MEEAKELLLKYWHEDAERVIQEAEHENNVMPFTDFLEHCTVCGGNWGGMLLTGIKELFPNVYKAIPNNMGMHAWECLCYTLILCGIIID